ncbi:hypothetical protein [Roseimaritima ulvae]|uniref:Uncharacterized protein n=1 Tax=Roseimaritima ulvae TaxID=980254 RepID=A0A5B9QPW7_9BACT|nr:hypothetical protein [Roseimaritima ulvae]QEG41048.1 hypothetical protein UC8_30660 [Roseimaritima ulvae]
MNLDDFNTSGPTARASQCVAELGAQASRPLQPGRTELEAFIAATRRELYALAESLEQAVQEPPAATADAPTQPNEPAARVNEPSAPIPPNSDAALQLQAAPLPTPPTPLPTTAETVAAADGDEDPLARLNAIKLRLAQQLENTL